MRFIHKWAYSCAKYLAKQLKENHEKRRVYYYGFQIIIGGMVKIAALVALASIIGALVPTLVILLVFATLRSLAGGYHMDTYGKCIATSLALFLAAGAIVRYTNAYWSNTALIALIAAAVVVCLFVIIKWAPGDTPNKPITEPEEKKKFKRLSIAYVAVWLLVTGILQYFGLTVYVMSFCFGLLLEAFIITPAGYRFFDMIKGTINNINKEQKLTKA